MIRRFTLLCLAGAAGSGLHLYSVKRDAQMQDREITRITREAKEVRSHASLLHAEYDLLSDPDRLKDLASQVLKLQPTDPKQYASLTDLDKRMPAIGNLPTLPAAPEPSVEAAPPPAQPVLQPEKADTTSAPPPVLAEKHPDAGSDKASQLARLMASLSPAQTAPASPAPAPPAPVVQAAATPATSPAPAQAPRPVTVAKPVAPTIVAESRPSPPRPSVQAVPAPIQRPMEIAATPTPRPIPAAIQATSQPAPAPYVGSALGMARMRAAPARYVPPAGDDR